LEQVARWESNMLKLVPKRSIENTTATTTTTTEVEEELTSIADIVTTEMDEALTKYRNDASNWRGLRLAMKGDPSAPKEWKDAYQRTLAEPGGQAKAERALGNLQGAYVQARDNFKKRYLAYLRLPIEADAHVTGGLVQKHLGFDYAPERMDFLDEDEPS
jgi:hypothetical protein